MKYLVTTCTHVWLTRTSEVEADSPDAAKQQEVEFIRDLLRPRRTLGAWIVNDTESPEAIECKGPLPF
jgi:hypothetical protein